MTTLNSLAVVDSATKAATHPKCPTCKAPLPGLLAACSKRRCLRVTTADEKHADRADGDLS